MNHQIKLTEDETIKILMQYLIKKGWEIEDHCLGYKRGCDITALKGSKKMLIEVKGAKSGAKEPIRKCFDSGQIKTHLGKAIVKVFEDKYGDSKCQVAIAHPNDEKIRAKIGHLIPFLTHLGIKHFWVSADGKVIEE